MQTSTSDNSPQYPTYSPRRGPRVSFANIRGLRHALREWGDPAAPPIILLHGWMDASSSWQFLVDAMPDHWRFVAPDWRGFGDSEWPQDGYWFADYHADLDALLDHLSPDVPATLIGHSMGGNIACIYAGLRPGRVAKLASLEGFGLPDTAADAAPDRLVQWLEHLREKPASLRSYASLSDLAERLRKANPRLTAPRSQYLAAEQARQIDSGFMLKHDPRHKAPGPIAYRLAEAQAAWRRVTAPTLWVQGDMSELLTRFHGKDDSDLSARAACFANIRRVTVPDAGHMLQHDQPEMLADCLKEFLGGR